MGIKNSFETTNIYIQILFEPLDKDIAMESEVLMLENSDLRGCPCALASQIFGYPLGQIDSPDGYIIFNSNIDWNCKFSGDVTNSYNLATMTLRGIARCLGFGSSIIEDGYDQYYFYFGWPSYFDKLVFHNSKWLSKLQQGSPEMAEFVKSDEVFVTGQSGQYRLYAPNQYSPSMSLCYLNDDNSLMSYSVGKGSLSLDIDNKTSDILRKIGWNLRSSGLDIKCNDISDNGIGSSYHPHTFSLSKGSENTSSHKWRFLLKNSQEEYVLISSGNGEDFTIPKVSSPEDYYVNVNGDLEGRVECDYILNGIYYSANPFSLSLELKPIINSIDNITIINDSQFEFSLMFDVRYTGADYVTVEIEEENNTSIRNTQFYEPYIAHIKTGRITNLDYSWITVIVSNKYGTTYNTLEYSPVYKLFNKTSHKSDSSLLKNENRKVDKINIFDMNGKWVFSGTSDDFKIQVLRKGMYIKKEIYDNGETKTSKITI